MCDFNPQGFKNTFCVGRIEIEISESGEQIRYRYRFGKVSGWQKIKTNRKGERYFRIWRDSYKLSDFKMYR